MYNFVFFRFPPFGYSVCQIHQDYQNKTTIELGDEIKNVMIDNLNQSREKYNSLYDDNQRSVLLTIFLSNNG